MQCDNVMHNNYTSQYLAPIKMESTPSDDSHGTCSIEVGATAQESSLNMSSKEDDGVKEVRCEDVEKQESYLATTEVVSAKYVNDRHEFRTIR